MEVEQKYWSFLLGEWKKGSWPHYYLMTTLLKTPEPTLLGAALGLGVLIVGIWRKMVKPEVISMFLFLIIPAAVCFASVSLQGGFNHHHRYVLMIYPPMFALAAYIASPVGIQLLHFRLPFHGPDKRSIAVPLALTLAEQRYLAQLTHGRKTKGNTEAQRSQSEMLWFPLCPLCLCGSISLLRRDRNHRPFKESCNSFPFFLVSRFENC
jgi:hypothetical protein